MGSATEIRKAREQRDEKVILEHLSNPSREVQEEAIRAAGALRLGAAVPRLAPLLRHEQAVVRSLALEALGLIGTDAAFGAVSEAAEGQEDWFKTKAIEILGRSEIRHLLPFLRDRDGAIRKSAYGAARAMGEDAVRDAARVALGERDAYLRRIALEWVASLDDPETQQLFERSLKDSRPEIRALAVDWLLKRSDDRVAALFDALSDERARARLGQIETLEGLKALLLRPCEQEAQRSFLARLAGRFGMDVLGILALELPSIRPLAAILGERPDFPLLLRKVLAEGRAELALEALALGDEELGALGLRHAAPSVRVAALNRLGPRGAASCVGDADDSVSWTAVSILLQNESLALAEREPLLRVLVRVTSSTDVEGRRMAVEGLVQLRALDELAGLQDVHDKVVLRKLAFTLADAEDPRSLIPMILVSEECGGEVARRARKRLPDLGLEALLELLRHRRGSVRKFAAVRLEGVTDERSVEPLLGAVNDESYEVQLAAVRALRKFIRRDDVADRFIECLHYGELSVREAAIEALGEEHVTRAIPALVGLLTHYLLKRKVMYALQQMGDRKAYLAVLRRKRRDEMIAQERAKVREANERRFKQRHAETR